jgi:fatty acid kinase
VPCTAQQAGLVSLVELDPEAALEENADRLAEALGGVRVGSVAAAARDDPQGRFVAGDAVGFVEEEIVAWGGAGTTLAATMERLASGAELLTVIAGASAPIALQEVGQHAPGGVELDLQDGGQPHYWWLLAAQ